MGNPFIHESTPRRQSLLCGNHRPPYTQCIMFKIVFGSTGPFVVTGLRIPSSSLSHWVGGKGLPSHSCIYIARVGCIVALANPNLTVATVVSIPDTVITLSKKISLVLFLSLARKCSCCTVLVVLSLKLMSAGDFVALFASALLSSDRFVLQPSNTIFTVMFLYKSNILTTNWKNVGGLFPRCGRQPPSSIGALGETGTVRNEVNSYIRQNLCYISVVLFCCNSALLNCLRVNSNCPPLILMVLLILTRASCKKNTFFLDWFITPNLLPMNLGMFWI